MARLWKSRALITCAAFLSLAIGAHAHANEQLTVPDLLHYARIGNPRSLDFRANSDPTPVYSSDGHFAAIVVSWGNAESETNDARVRIYDTSSVEPDRIVSESPVFASSSGYRPIAMARWSADGRYLYFAATQGRASSQVFRMEIGSGNVKQITRLLQQLIWYDVSDTGRVIASVERSLVANDKNEVCEMYGCRADEPHLLYTERGGSLRLTDLIVFDEGSTGRQMPRPEMLDRRLHFCLPEIPGGISPDGRFVVQMCRYNESELRPEWTQYTMHPYLQDSIRSRNPRVWARAFVLDIDSEALEPLIDEPYAVSYFTTDPVWINGGRHLLFPAALPALSRRRRDRQALDHYEARLFNPVERKNTRVVDLPKGVARIVRSEWSETAQSLFVNAVDAQRQPLPMMQLKRRKRGWAIAQSAQYEKHEHKKRWRYEVRQSLNGRPVLFANSLDRPTGVAVYDPNPWLEDKEVPEVRQLEWTTSDGEMWVGGLILPSGYQSDRRYPLVIQTHGFQPDEFSLQGASRNYPGAVFAGNGVAVLQVREKTASVLASPKLWEVSREGYERAIDLLDREGIIDRDRVGIIGWSATGPQVASLLTHSEYPIAAAAFTPTMIYGYWRALYNAQGADDSIFGSPPFGSGIRPWLEQSPSMNLHRVRAPLLIWASTTGGGIWDWYSGLRLQDKPVELWSFPTGTHEVYQASHFLRTNQMLVDWFLFWLNDVERQIPVGAESKELLSQQYDRWRELRRLQDDVLKHPREPLLEWNSRPLSEVDQTTKPDE